MSTQRHGLFYVVLCVSAAVAACKTISVNSGSAVKVIGGTEDYTTNPATVGLIMRGGAHVGLCTGAVVRDDLIVTAAHCVVDGQSKTAGPFFNLSDGAHDVLLKGVVSSTLLPFPSYVAPNDAHPILTGMSSDIAFAVFPKGAFKDYPQAKFANQGVIQGEVVTLAGYGDTSFHDDTSNLQAKRFSGTNRVAEISHVLADAIVLNSDTVGMTTAGLGQGDSGGALYNSSGEIVGISKANSMHVPVGSSAGNVNISAQNPLTSLYVNVRDPGVAAFIAAVMNDPNPTQATVQGITATPISLGGGGSGTSGALSCPGNRYCKGGWGWLNDGEGGCSSSNSQWKSDLKGCSCACGS